MSFDPLGVSQPVMDLRVAQIGHNLGPRVLGDPVQLFPMTT